MSVQLGTGDYSDGSGFGSATEVFFAATGTTTWTLAFAGTNLLTQSALVHARAVDYSGNIESERHGDVQLYSVHGDRRQRLERSERRRRWNQPAEPGLAGWTVFLDTNQNGTLDSGELQTTTGANGSYAFAALPAGTYTVAEVPQAGWQQTYPGSAGTAASTSSRSTPAMTQAASISATTTLRRPVRRSPFRPTGESIMRRIGRRDHGNRRRRKRIGG